MVEAVVYIIEPIEVMCIGREEEQHARRAGAAYDGSGACAFARVRAVSARA